MKDFDQKQEILNAVAKVLENLSSEPSPKKLLSRVNAELEDSIGVETTMDEIWRLGFNPNDGAHEAEIRRLKVQLQINCTRWANAKTGTWSDSPTGSIQRYRDSLESLGFTADHLTKIIGECPYVSGNPVIITDGKRKKWYGDEAKNRSSFYWKDYRELLASKSSYTESSIVKLDRETDAVVEQLDDPTVLDFATRGLVVGHVQSGKTSNFAGVIAKSIDAGYRLIIVLSGNTESLRAQTQRRLDMELVGTANILDGKTKEHNSDWYNKLDYVQSSNRNFPDKFIKHDLSVLNNAQAPKILRLTDSNSDYAKLQSAIAAINPFDFYAEVPNKQTEIYSWENLKSMRVRLLVVKKQKNNLEKVIAELYENRSAQERQILAQIPTLIIDDESDQASINTKKPIDDHAGQLSTKTKKFNDVQSDERTKINDLIVKLLNNLKRAQYVGYTATPFANVLINSGDPVDLFPRHFILPLSKSEGYMGAGEFHDVIPLDEIDAENVEMSNKKAFIREWLNTNPESPAASSIDEDSLRKAIDSYVLSGAIRLWREANGWRLDNTHHTMLVHYTHLTNDASQVVSEINSRIWPLLMYSDAEGQKRLEDLFTEDFTKVTEARGKTALLTQGESAAQLALKCLPETFEDLILHIDEAIQRISLAGNVAREVNANANNVNFDTEPTWKILIGGNLLSRGFTVEGLTISYFLRAAKTQDTLMQMGRWYGFRTGYEDLVRLYLPDLVLWKKKTRTQPARFANLCELFTQSAAREEQFRDQLTIYSEVSDKDGVSIITPEHIPPMVFRAAPELMPVARNKMWNAIMDFEGQGGKSVDLYSLRVDEGVSNRENFEAVKFILEKCTSENLRNVLGYRENQDHSRKYDARNEWLIEASNSEVLLLLEAMKFDEDYRIAADIKTIKMAIESGHLEKWLVLVLDPKSDKDRKSKLVNGFEVNLLKRTRDESRPTFHRSLPFNRSIIEQIAGLPDAEFLAKIDSEGANNPISKNTGGLFLSFTFDDLSAVDPNEKLKPEIPVEGIATLVTYALPYEWSPKGEIGFRTRGQVGEIVVDSADSSEEI